MAQGLPKGFVLDDPDTNTQGLPEDFTLDTPEQESPEGSIVPPPEFNLDTPRKKELHAEAQKRGLLGILKGAGEVGLTVASSAIAEPSAGLMGLQTGLEPGAVETTREAMTYMPKSEAGQEYLGELGELMEPVGEWFKNIETELGDKAFEITDSPAIAAAATTIPTAIIEALGLGAGGKLIKGVKNIKKARASGKIARSISEATPTKDTLFNVASKIYDEIDESGAVIKADKFNSLVDNINTITKKAGLDPDLTPKASKVMNRFIEEQGTDIKVTDLDVLRKKAKLAAKSIEPADSSLGVKIIDEVDDFFADLTDEDFTTTGGLEAADIGTKYQVAQDLWGRARKSEMLDRAFRRARDANSGMENGIRNEFKSILLSDKKRKFFDKAEIEAMEKVSRGDKAVNLAKLIGRFGWSEGKATSFLGASIGAGAGFAGGGPAGALAVPMIGQVSKKLAQRMTINNAEFANQVIRAGKNSKKIAEAYFDNTAPALRTSEELSELLMRQDINLNKLPKTKLARESKNIVENLKSKLKEERGSMSFKPSEKPIDTERFIPKTGEPFNFSFVRNTEKSPNFGSRYGQDIEPAGRYMTVGKAENVKDIPSFEHGEIQFDKPLVIDFGGGYGEPSNWKNVVSKKYGGKKGIKLTEALKKDGYDGIVTVSESGLNKYTSEVLDLNVGGKNKALPVKDLTTEARKYKSAEEFVESQTSKKGSVTEIPTERNIYSKSLELEEVGEAVQRKYPTYGESLQEVKDSFDHMIKNDTKKYNNYLKEYKGTGTIEDRFFMGMESSPGKVLKEAKDELGRTVKNRGEAILEHKSIEKKFFNAGKGWISPEKVLEYDQLTEIWNKAQKGK